MAQSTLFSPDRYMAIGVASGLLLAFYPELAITLGLACGVVWVVTLVLRRARRHARIRAEKHEWHVAERTRTEQERELAALRRKYEELANRPPPPTQEERIAAAKRRYDARVSALENAGLDEMEVGAAREHAKQQYLRDLDEALR